MDGVEGAGAVKMTCGLKGLEDVNENVTGELVIAVSEAAFGVLYEAVLGEALRATGRVALEATLEVALGAVLGAVLGSSVDAWLSTCFWKTIRMAA